ncbi:MAG: hypothetical protein ACJAV7_002870 [Flavobacteriales bacterium]|jgi:hypothetical protein
MNCKVTSSKAFSFQKAKFDTFTYFYEDRYSQLQSTH